MWSMKDLKKSTQVLLETHVMDDMSRVRRHLHRYPEVGNAYQTARYLHNELTKASLNPQWIEPARSGLTCDIGTKKPGMLRVAIRADIDALPVWDKTQTEYSSQVPGVSHACGHDVHASVVLGTGLILAEHMRQLAESDIEPDVCVRLIFEGPEETVDEIRPEEQPPNPEAPRYDDAAKAIAGGAMDDVDIVVALHTVDGQFSRDNEDNWTNIVQIAAGPISSHGSKIRVAFKGPGGHGARPECTLDIVEALGLVTTNLRPLLRETVKRHGYEDHVTVSFGASATNSRENAVLGSFGEALGGIRFLHPSLARNLQELLHQTMCQALTRLIDLNEKYLVPNGRWNEGPDDHNAMARFEYRVGTSPVVNTPAIASILAASTRQMLGHNAVTGMHVSRGGESFYKYISYARLGGAMFRLATGRAQENHAPDFDVDEQCMTAGAAALVSFVHNAARMAEPYLKTGELSPIAVPPTSEMLKPNPHREWTYEFPLTAINGYLTKEQTAPYVAPPEESACQ